MTDYIFGSTPNGRSENEKISAGDSVLLVIEGREYAGTVKKKGRKLLHVSIDKGTEYTVEIETFRVVAKSGHTLGRCYVSLSQYTNETNLCKANSRLLSLVNDPDVRSKLGYEKMKRIIDIIEGE